MSLRLCVFVSTCVAVNKLTSQRSSKYFCFVFACICTYACAYVHEFGHASTYVYLCVRARLAPLHICTGPKSTQLLCLISFLTPLSYSPSLSISISLCFSPLSYSTSLLLFLSLSLPFSLSLLLYLSFSLTLLPFLSPSAFIFVSVLFSPSYSFLFYFSLLICLLYFLGDYTSHIACGALL